MRFVLSSPIVAPDRLKADEAKERLSKDIILPGVWMLISLLADNETLAWLPIDVIDVFAVAASDPKSIMAACIPREDSRPTDSTCIW